MIQCRTGERDGRRVYDVRLRDYEGREYTKTFFTKRVAEAFETNRAVVCSADAAIHVMKRSPLSPSAGFFVGFEGSYSSSL
jgi:hypothetical protein